MFNFKPGRVVNLECVCEISMLPTSTTYLEVLEMSTVCSIMVEKFKFPAVGYLPWPICRFKNSKQKLHTKSKKSAKLLFIFNSPPLVWFFVRVFHPQLIIITVLTCITRSFLGFKKTGCRRRNVLKEDLVAEDKIRKLVSSLWARLPGYGQKRPRYQWVPGYPMVWDMENLV